MPTHRPLDLSDPRPDAGRTRAASTTSSLETRPSPGLSAPLLCPQDAAALLSVRTSWIYDAVRTGRLPCLRIGRHIRFTQTMLEDWLQQQ